MTAPAREIETLPALDNTGNLDDLEHIWCELCGDPDRALCGALLDPDEGLCPEHPCNHLECIVCADLATTHPCVVRR